MCDGASHEAISLTTSGPVRVTSVAASARLVITVRATARSRRLMSGSSSIPMVSADRTKRVTCSRRPSAVGLSASPTTRRTSKICDPRADMWERTWVVALANGIRVPSRQTLVGSKVVEFPSGLLLVIASRVVAFLHRFAPVRFRGAGARVRRVANRTTDRRIGPCPT